MASIGILSMVAIQTPNASYGPENHAVSSVHPIHRVIRI
jgi:hypothetical protein